MKVILVIFLLGLVAASVPLAKIIDGTRMCYVTRKTDFDELAFRAKARTWDERSLCEQELEAIVSLEECLTDINQKLHPIFRQKLTPAINEAVQLLRYGQKDIAVLSDEHDRQCAAFPSLMIHPTEERR